MNKLGVNISIPKSHISPNMYEFAKRVFFKGVEISGIQIRGLIENQNKYWLLYANLFTLIYDRKYYSEYTIPVIFKELLIIQGKRVKEINNLVNRFNLLHAFNYYLNFDDKSKLILYLKDRYKSYEGQLDFPQIELNNLVYLALDSINSSIALELTKYIDSFKDQKDLVESATLGLADESDLYTSPLFYIYNTPFLYGIINLLKSLKSSSKEDTFKEMIKAIALPLPEQFEQRTAIRLAGAQSRTAKRFLAEIDRLIQERPARVPTPPLQSAMLGYVGDT
jgi:hypothetical protein